MDDNTEDRPVVEKSAETAHELFADVIVPTNPPKIRRIIFASLCIFVALAATYQTRVCTTFVGSLIVSHADVEQEIKQSKRLQAEVMEKLKDMNAPEPQPTVMPHPVFFGSNSDKPQYGELIVKTANSLVGDQNVCANFPALDGIPLQQTRAVVVPLWMISVYGNRKQMGITEAGYVCSEDDTTGSPAAITIREKPSNEQCVKRLDVAKVDYAVTKNGIPHMTDDGVPRVALSEGVLNNPSELKLTLLHEFMHVHGAPGLRPIFNLVHDDLTYLPEYNEMLNKLHLNAISNRQDTVLWTFALTGLLFATVNFYRAKRRPDASSLNRL